MLTSKHRYYLAFTTGESRTTSVVFIQSALTMNRFNSTPLIWWTAFFLALSFLTIWRFVVWSTSIVWTSVEYCNMIFKKYICIRISFKISFFLILPFWRYFDKLCTFFTLFPITFTLETKSFQTSIQFTRTGLSYTKHIIMINKITTFKHARLTVDGMNCDKANCNCNL